MKQTWLSELKCTSNGAYVTPNEPLKGRAAVVLGGGPSLTRDVADQLIEFPCLFANNAYMLARSPSVVVALDRRWFGWHGQMVKAMGHKVFTAIREGASMPFDGDLNRMHKDRESIWPASRSALPGTNSGHAAAALAFILGADTVYVAGFDMGFPNGRSHWHEPHRVPPSQANYELRFRPAIEKMAQMALERGKMLASVTDTMADIPRVPLAQALGDLRTHENRVDHSAASTSLPE